MHKTIYFFKNKVNFKKDMKRFKLFLISLCLFSLSTPALAEFDEESYYYGYLRGYLSSTCFNYIKGHLTEEKAKKSFKASISSIDKLIQNNSYKIKLLEFADNSKNSECKKLMP